MSISVIKVDSPRIEEVKDLKSLTCPQGGRNIVIVSTLNNYKEVLGSIAEQVLAAPSEYCTLENFSSLFNDLKVNLEASFKNGKASPFDLLIFPGQFNAFVELLHRKIFPYLPKRKNQKVKNQDQAFLVDKILSFGETIGMNLVAKLIANSSMNYRSTDLVNAFSYPKEPVKGQLEIDPRAQLVREISLAISHRTQKAISTADGQIIHSLITGYVGFVGPEGMLKVVGPQFIDVTVEAARKAVLELNSQELTGGDRALA